MKTNRTALYMAPLTLFLAFIVGVPLLLAPDDCSPDTIATGSSSNAISVMSWNLCGSACPDWPTRSRHMAAKVGQIAPDVAVVQEGGWTLNERRPTMQAFKSLGYATANDKDPHLGRYTYYNPAKFQAVSAGSFGLGGAHGMSWTKLRTRADRQTFVVVDVHLNWPKSADADRERQMREGMAKLAPIAGDLPTIWAGDFNSNSSRADDAPARIMAASGHVDTIDVAADVKNADVNSARSSRSPTAKVKRNGDQVDHIYVDKTMTVSTWRQYVDTNATGDRYVAPFITDHNPILAVVGIPGPSGPAADIAPAAATSEPIGRWNAEQVHNAAIIAEVGKRMQIPERGRAIAIMTAMGESSLTVIDRGDAAGPDSRGLFQQRDSWGPYADRMNPAKSAALFYRALQKVNGWQDLEPTMAAHRVQRNADPFHYAKFWDDAVQVYAVVSGTNLSLQDLATSSALCDGDTELVSYVSGEDCDFAGYKNPLSCQEALAKASQIARTSSCRSDLPGGTWRRWCLAFVAKAYGHQFAGYPTALDMYRDMKARGLISTNKKIPAGALVFFSSSSAAGHVALYAGNGMAFSNDYIRSGCIDLTPMDRMGSGGRYLGWSPPAFPGT